MLTPRTIAFHLIVIAAAATNSITTAAQADDLTWHNVTATEVAGTGWSDPEHPFNRLPARAEKIVRPPVWHLSRNSTGLSVDFTTNSPRIAVRWTLNTPDLAMNHMPATGVSGVDLYVRHEGHWHYLATGRPEATTNEAELVAGLEPAEADYRLYLPLYNGIAKLEIGVPANASFQFAATPDPKKPPVVIYGTSITQGGCASRPGMAYTSILGRRLDMPVINLGFSGNGKAEPELARLLAEIEPSAYVLDPLPNLDPEDVRDRLPEFIDILRSRHPKTPILLVESPLFPDTKFVAAAAHRINDKNQFLRQVFENRVADGDQAIFLVPACDLTADGGEATVDALHPTDLGFVLLADSIEPYLRKALGLQQENNSIKENR
jgi:hypothetical protein